MSKFTTRVVFSHVLFEILVKTRVTHVSEQITREGLVHASLDRVWEVFTCLLTKNSYKLRLAIGCTRQAMTMHRRANNAQSYRN